MRECFCISKKRVATVLDERYAFPIDIVWIGEDMRIVGITKNVSPETFPEVFRPPLPARYVLETKSGLADTRAIEIGEYITPRFTQ